MGKETTNKLAKFKKLQAGRSIIVTSGKKKWVYTSAVKEEREALIKLLTSYDKLPNEQKYSKIIRLLEPQTTKKEIAVKTQRKKIKNELKVVKGELKSATKQLKEGNTDISKYLAKDKRFEIKGGNIYLKPFDTVPMPIGLIDKVVSCIKNDVDVQPYINFWMLCLLNPNPIARTKLFDYLSRHNLLVTPSGYFVTFRMVKKTTRKTAKGEPIYTSARTGKEDYVMGTSYKMDRKDCDEDGQNDCSRGLHTGSPLFIGIEVGDGYGVKTVTTKVANPNSYGTGYENPKYEDRTESFDQTFGNQAAICLVSPMHVVSIPFSDTRKMRSCELYFCKTTTAEEVIDLMENDYLIYDHQYKVYEAEQLKEMLKDTKLVNYVSKDKPDSTAAMAAKIADLKQRLSVSGDVVNTQGLSLAQINLIIKSRLVTK